jgi:hypothetical protein
LKVYYVCVVNQLTNNNKTNIMITKISYQGESPKVYTADNMTDLCFDMERIAAYTAGAERFAALLPLDDDNVMSAIRECFNGEAIGHISIIAGRKVYRAGNLIIHTA